MADAEDTIIEPSPKRVRNILTLEERVRAIQAYDCRPMYTKVAKMFNCSWEQIKNIIQNRDAILEFYEAIKRNEKTTDPNKEEMRERKIGFLGECMYEYIQRLQFYTKQDITENIIRTKANEFREIIQIPHFMPTKGWLNHFKATYNFSLSNRQITLTRTPPASLDLKDIMTYCTKHKPTVELNFTPQESRSTFHRWRTEVDVLTIHNAALKDFQERQQRKINFLEKALHEYVQRAQFHQKIQMSDETLVETSSGLRDMLKIENFQPDTKWLEQWKTRWEFNNKTSNQAVRTPPLSLDLRDILSYCSRHDGKNQIGTSIKLAPKDPTDVPAFKKIKLVSPKEQPVQLVPIPELKAEIIDLDDIGIGIGIGVGIDNDNDTDNDVKPNIVDLVINNDDTYNSSDAEQQQLPTLNTIKSETDMHPQSPGHWSEHSDNEELPRSVRSYNDALKLLKPLEEFAMLQENYRVIGLITQLEEIFKNEIK